MDAKQEKNETNLVLRCQTYYPAQIITVPSSRLLSVLLGPMLVALLLAAVTCKGRGAVSSRSVSGLPQPPWRAIVAFWSN